MELDTDMDISLCNISANKWWRLFDLTGIRVKLTKPVSLFAHHNFKGDRNYITITAYTGRLILGFGYDTIPKWRLNDDVYYTDESDIIDKSNTINLSLLDFDYLYNLLTN